MPKAGSHAPDNKSERIYSGEKEARDVVGWLNWRRFKDEAAERLYQKLAGKGRPVYPQQCRVIEILRLYQQVKADWEIRASTDPKHVDQQKGVRALRMLTRKLRRYTFYPVFLPHFPIRFGWWPTRKQSPDRYDDVSAVLDIAKLAERDLLGRLKECPCGKWIWARFSHQRFCSAKCREREFRSSEQWKEHRRQKAREYYKLHKSGKVK